MKYFVCCFLLIINITNVCSKAEEKQAKLVDAMVIKNGNLQKEIRVIGTVYSQKESPGITRADGILNHIKRSGEVVKADEIYAEILQSENNKRYLISKKEQKLAKKQLERMQKLHKDGSVSDSKYDIAQQNFLDKKQQKLEIKKENSQYKLKAPFDGILGTYLVPEGYNAKSGQNIVTVYDPSKLEVKFNIPANFIRKIKKGMKFRINKKIYKLPMNFKFIQRETQSIPVYFPIKAEKYYLGELLDIFLITEEKKDIITVPQDAVFLENNTNYVYLINKEDKLEKKQIILGFENKEKVEIKDGLNVGDKIVSFNPTRLWETMHVKYKIKKGN